MNAPETNKPRQRPAQGHHAPTISICICTRDRPESLRTCLESVLVADDAPDEIIVSDDSERPDTTRAICAEFDLVTYKRGPRRGLWANRNAVLRASSGDWIAFLDDDAMVSADFVRTSREIVATPVADTVYTGRVVNDGVLSGAPGARTFLGHFGPAPPGRVKNVHIQCSNLFPRSAFEVASFDEAIKYGYEDMDVADQLLAADFRIEFRPDLVNFHTSPKITEEEQRVREAESVRARFYVTIKHHLRRRNFASVLIFAVAASFHEAAHRAKTRHGSPVLGAFSDMWWAWRQARVWT